MPEFYTTAAGETRTTCGRHRTLGYDYVEDWVCRGCGAPQAIHETTDETLARNANLTDLLNPI